MKAAPIIVALLILAAPPAAAFEFGTAPNPVLQLDSRRAGETPGHRLTFAVLAGELELHRATLVYPAGFRFNGFDALGPPGTPVGQYEIDLNLDGTPEATVALLSLSDRRAQADILRTGVTVSGLVPVLDHMGGGEFRLRLPFGGDLDASTLVVPASARITLVLFPGLLRNPDAAGLYTIVAQLVSVDPDTDGADDGANEPPRKVAFEVSLAIEAPRLPGDVNGDGVVDITDVNLITAARNTSAAGPDDPRDLDGDGMITILDARRAVTLCSKPRCAP